MTKTINVKYVAVDGKKLVGKFHSRQPLSLISLVHTNCQHMDRVRFGHTKENMTQH